MTNNLCSLANQNLEKLDAQIDVVVKLVAGKKSNSCKLRCHGCQSHGGHTKIQSTVHRYFEQVVLNDATGHEAHRVLYDTKLCISEAAQFNN